MAEYFNRVDVEEWLKDICEATESDAEYVLSRVDEIQSSDVAEVKRGEWVEYLECLRYMNAYSPDHVVCSVCEECFSIFDDSVDRFDFCPHCGARMDSE